MKKHNFTLVELLAVLVIMSILLGISIPAFRSLTRGNAPDRAAREIMGRVAATRAYAAAQRKSLALVFMAYEHGNFPTEYAFSAYRSCEVYEASSNNWQFVRWVKGDSWTTLPAGIMVGLPYNFSAGLLTSVSCRPVQSAGSISGTSTSDIRAEAVSATTAHPNSLTINGCDMSEFKAGTVNMTNAIVFLKSGLIQNPCIIELREAVHDGDSIKAVSTTSPQEYYPLVVRKTGKCVYYPELVTYGQPLSSD